MKKGIEWDDNLIARLKALHKSGTRSFAQIAETMSREFGIKLSKNACIGKASRIGLEKRAKGTPTPRPRRKHKAAKKHRTLTTPQLSVVPAVAAAWKVEPPMLPASCGRITIYQLKGGLCHYPFGDKPPYAYCGNTAFRGSSWCPHHERVIYPRRIV